MILSAFFATTEVVMVVVMLLTSGLNPEPQDKPTQIIPNEFVGIKASQIRTQITMEVSPPRYIFVGDDVRISGQLITLDGTGVAEKIISIFALTPAPETVLLTSLVTGNDGSYEFLWNAKGPVKVSSSETTYQEIRSDLKQSLLIYSVFEGDEEFAPAKSNVHGVILKLKDLLTKISTQKIEYATGENALVFIEFIEGDIGGSKSNFEDSKSNFGDRVDPAEIRAFYDRVSVTLERKDVGSYFFITPGLTGEHHQLAVMPTKEGFNPHSAFYTILVKGVR